MAGARAWREAATLILTARQPAAEAAQHDYKVLMLQRSSRSKFMPNAFVFPGGVAAEADFSPAWLDLFRELGRPAPSSALPGRPRPLLMRTDRPEGGLCPSLAFRLAAIRETFEESGVLLLEGDTPVPGSLADWRAAVHREPARLLDLCRAARALPDVGALAEWADWLTPVGLHEQGTRRFDTVFYTAHLGSLPDTLLDQQEVTAVRWEEPAELLRQFAERKLWLAPPQVYELSRLLHFSEQEELRSFAKKREAEGLLTWLPVRLECTDGMLSLYPGDSMYPANPDYVGDKDAELAKYPGTMAECLAASPAANRQRFPDQYLGPGQLSVTCPPSLGHLTPRPWEEGGPATSAPGAL